MTASVFAGRTFTAGDTIYMNCNAVSWWCNDGVSQTMYFVDAASASTSVVGVVYDAPNKIYAFPAPAGTFEYLYEQRGTWNKTGNISLTGTEGNNYIILFAENDTKVTWGSIGDAPLEDETHYLYVTDGSTHWDNLYVYAWGGKDWFGAWPGMDVRSAAMEGGAYKLAMTGQPGSAVNLIFHNNVSGHQYDSDKFTFGADHYVTTLDPDAPLVPAGVALWPAAAVLPTAVPAEVKILSLNNSLIHYENEFQDVMFNQMAAAMGKNAAWTAHTNLGKTLKFHWDEGEGMTETGTVSARKLMRDNAYTHIILQEQTNKPLTNFAGFRESVVQWVEYIRTTAANPNAVIILPINWALIGSGDIHSNNATLKQAYLDMAQELGLVLSPVGVAYELAYTADNSVMTQGNRWFKDDRHPTQMTTYLGAVLEYSVIYGVDPLTITWAPTTVTPTEAASMRQYAHDALAATAQPVNIQNHTIRYEVRQIDANGISIATMGATYSGAQLTDSIFTCATAGEYSVSAVCGEDNLSATVKVADMVTTVVKLPSIKVNTTHTIVAENFDTIGYPAAGATVIEKGYYGKDYTLPTAWRMERNQVGPRTIGTYSDAMLTAQYGGGENLPTGAANGTWNLGANGNSDRALGGMTTGVENGARTINIMAHLENDGTKDFDTIRVAYDIEKYREGSNANEFYVKLFTSTNGVAWVEAGENFSWLNPKGTAQTGFAIVPGFTQHVEADLVYHFAAGTDLYLCWSISTSAGENCAAAPCLAIDNVNLEFVPAAVPEAAHYLYVEDQTGWDCLAVYAFGDSELYGAWPGQVMIDEKEIEGVTYKVYPFDVTADGAYTLIFNNCNNGTQLANYPITEARDYYFTVTTSGVTDKSATALDNTPISVAATKQLVVNGNHTGVIILRAGHRYSVLGTRLN